MTLLVFFLVLFASILHAGWNFAAKKAAGDLSVMWLGICLASGLSWPFAAIVWQPEHQPSPASTSSPRVCSMPAILVPWPKPIALATFRSSIP